jgi:hypothetical protein
MSFTVRCESCEGSGFVRGIAGDEFGPDEWVPCSGGDTRGRDCSDCDGAGEFAVLCVTKGCDQPKSREDGLCEYCGADRDFYAAIDAGADLGGGS